MVKYVLFGKRMFHTIYNIHHWKLWPVPIGKSNLWSKYIIGHNILFTHVPLCTQKRIP